MSSCRVYVAGKDMHARVAHVARGRHHPALYSAEAALQRAHWIAGGPPRELAQTGRLACTYKARRALCFCASFLPGKPLEAHK